MVKGGVLGKAMPGAWAAAAQAMWPQMHTGREPEHLKALHIELSLLLRSCTGPA